MQISTGVRSNSFKIVLFRAPTVGVNCLLTLEKKWYSFTYSQAHICLFSNSSEQLLFGFPVRVLYCLFVFVLLT